MVGIVVILFLTIGEMLSMPFMNSFWIARTTTYNRGDYAGLYSMAWSIAQVVAPTAGGLLILHGGFPVLWWLVGAACLLASAGFIFLYRVNYKRSTKH